MPNNRVGTVNLLHLLDEWRGERGSTWASLASRLRLLIIDGRITSNSLMPPERQLAVALNLSRTTVNAAYAALREDGFLTTRRGSGSIAQVPGATRPDPVTTRQRRDRPQPRHLELGAGR